MKKNDNLVMFPSSKNFAINADLDQHLTDPMDDILNEFSHLTDKEIPSHLDDRFNLLQEREEGEGSFNSLEEYMASKRKQLSQPPEDEKLCLLIDEKISFIKISQERIKFYLEEIEMFLPDRKTKN